MKTGNVRRLVRWRKRQSGASLLEVLVAVLIMSFGLLSLAGLAAAAQQYAKMAQFQTVGGQLASDYAERMRANATGFGLDLYNKTVPYSTAAATSAACADPGLCTTAELAAQDKASWTNELRRRLPGGDAFVRRDSVNVLAVDLWILWVDPDLAVGSSTAGANDCPTDAVSAIPSGSPLPRCMYFRVSI